MSEHKANLFVVGAMKAGTTTFMEQLALHKEIYVSPIKEPHFFVDKLPINLYEPSRFFDEDHYFEKEFPAPLHICKLESAEHYKTLFSMRRNESILAEGSTAYLHAPEAAEKIHRYNANARIIILLRDPLKRAHSHYQMDLGKGRVKDAFETVVSREIERYETASLEWNSYIGMSSYDSTVARYRSLFQQVLVLKFEDWIGDQEKALETVAEFLEVGAFPSRESAHRNASRSLRFQKVFYFLKQLGLKDYFSKVFGTKFKQWLFRKVSSDKKVAIKLSPDTAEKLSSIFTKESGTCYY
ncbi:MAG: sulfotransferase [Bacteroidota bacterium]